ncbi:MAG TPA: hypothetical protein VMX17_05940 [Candidatus Glassbacteria bacterium]|nr:hypothetical protein [Candidatus Glassbacteria bacterium]
MSDLNQSVTDYTKTHYYRITFKDALGTESIHEVYSDDEDESVKMAFSSWLEENIQILSGEDKRFGSTLKDNANYFILPSVGVEIEKRPWIKKELL